MKFKFVVIFGFLLQLKTVSLRGIRSEKDQFYVDDDFTEVAKTSNGGGSDSSLKSLSSNILLEKVKPPNEPGVAIDSTHQTVDQENVGSDKRRKFVNGRNNHYQPINVTAELVASQKNGTWNLEKKEKTMDLESQPITCHVTTEELVATAQATVTRALKGLCSAKDMEDRFEELENSLSNQLNTIKTMLLNLEERLGEHGDAVMYGQKQLSAAISKGCSGSLNGNGGIISLNTDLNNKNQKMPHDYPGSKSNPSLNGLSDAGEDVSNEDVSGTRYPEILKFNSSIHMETSLTGPPKKVFTYYWKIKDMMYKLTGWNPRKSVRSQSFYIFPSGYRMYMRVFPRQNEENFAVRVGLTKGEFDDTLKWPFPLKHKIHILDQTKEGRLFEDIASRIWDPNLLCSDFNWQKPIKGDNHECVEIGFPHDVLKQREYIRRDVLVIKLTVYLEP